MSFVNCYTAVIANRTIERQRKQRWSEELYHQRKQDCFPYIAEIAPIDNCLHLGGKSEYGNKPAQTTKETFNSASYIHVLPHVILRPAWLLHDPVMFELFIYNKMCHQEPNMGENFSTPSQLPSMMISSAMAGCISKHLHPYITNHLPFLFLIRYSLQLGCKPTCIK